MPRSFRHPMPFGWCSVGRLNELTDEVTAVDAFGSQVVVWIDGDGGRHVMDPVCPHLGAPPVVGGTVERQQSFSTSRGEFIGDPISNRIGPGIGHIEFRLFGTVTLISTTTPIDDETVHIRFTFFHEGSEIAARVATPFVAEVDRQFDQDIPIWEAKTYLPVPALAPTEKPITELRKWAAQFDA